MGIGESDGRLKKYRIISLAGLENHYGDRAAMFLSSRNRNNRKHTFGRIDIDSDEEWCLRADGYGEKIKIQHGDAIRIKMNGRGENSIRNYIFIDESD